MDKINRTKNEFDEHTLNALLARKVDMRDLEKLNEVTASKKDTEEIMDSVNMLNQQLLHSIVLLNEAVKLSLDQTPETRQSKDKKVVNLIRQV